MMKRTTGFVVGVLMVATQALAAGAITPLGYDNVHIRVSDPAKARDWYIKYLGATASGGVRLGKIPVVFVKTDVQQPSTGSVIDHIGLSFADLDAKMKDFEAGGAKILQAPRDVPGLFKLGFIEDPWGVKFEVLQDPDHIGFHHVHLRVRDPEATLKWYYEMLGGERSKLKGRIDGVRYGEVWLLAASSGNETPVPSADRAIQNLAWGSSDVDAATAELKRRGVTIATEPTAAARGTMRFAFIDDPNGVRFELLQRLQP